MIKNLKSQPTAEMISTERELITAIVEGNEKAFSKLFFQYLPVLKSFAFKFSKSEHAAEEIIQDAFVRVWLNRDKLEGVQNVKAYLYKYVSNECLSHLRKRLNEEKLISRFSVHHPKDSNITDELIQLNEINRIVANSVNKLPSQRRKIYQLSRNEGKSIPQIAECLGISQHTVKNALVIALKTIRIELELNGITFILPLLILFFKEFKIK
jgi:RNA polymerase sigma-70 factor (family 1)